ncbi:hypothetical protein [Mycobacterium sp. DL440]|uniref:hypothetical protein n=1 Tax=Mycobacterium sp. DL440 TaxID=2675523 RepID=UPI001AAF81D5|nr:hypothetical protein [Mycobacterium sp. DL440]
MPSAGTGRPSSSILADKKESLEQTLFGLPSGSDANKIIAYRDAQDRAARVTDRETALKVYNSALISNDDSLAKVILAKAVEFNYREIVDDYTRRHPIWREELNDLAAIQTYSTDGNKMLQTNMSYTLVRGVSAGYTDGFVDLAL